MKRWMTLAACIAPASAALCAMAGEVTLSQPGFGTSKVDASGRLVEDWGSVGFKLALNGRSEPLTFQVTPTKLNGLVSAASGKGAALGLTVESAAYRAPAFPSGLDVLTLKIANPGASDVTPLLTLDLPAGAVVGERSVAMGGRTVLSLPMAPNVDQEVREWGACDESQPMPGWGSPNVPCDPAFRNIRAGMGGVPIKYRFAVEPREAVTVALGFCESFWAVAGQRVMLARVEGAPRQSVDPVAKWGQHKPGILTFAGRDANGDGQIDVAVIPSSSAGDQNPILNAIWLLPAGAPADPATLISGAMNQSAMRFVDVGGPGDQAIYGSGKAEFTVTIPAKGSRELTFIVACPGASVTPPSRSAWSAATLLKAATDVARDAPTR